jgi:hypothetical protein
MEDLEGVFGPGVFEFNGHRHCLSFPLVVQTLRLSDAGYRHGLAAVE